MSSSPPFSVLFVGLGAMGYHMAAHIAAADLSLVSSSYVYNRTVSTAKKHVDENGGRVISKLPQGLESLPAEARPNVVVLCLPTSNIVSSVVDQILSGGAKGLQKGCIFIDCTSGKPQVTTAIGRRIQAAGMHMIDAPVSGGPEGSKKGSLAVIAGGDAEIVKKVLPLLHLFGRSITHVGGLGAGHAVKAVNNTLNTSHLILAAEGLAVLSKMGICPKVAVSAINESSGRSLMTEARIPGDVVRIYIYIFFSFLCSCSSVPYVRRIFCLLPS